MQARNPRRTETLQPQRHSSSAALPWKRAGAGLDRVLLAGWQHNRTADAVQGVEEDCPVQAVEDRRHFCQV